MFTSVTIKRVSRLPIPLTRTIATTPPRPPAYNPDGTDESDPGFRGSKTRIANLDERSVLVGMGLAAAFGVGMWYVNKEPDARKEYERVKEGFIKGPSASSKA